MANTALPHGKFGAGGDSNLLLHNIHAGNLLGDRMFHLQAGVHFHKIKITLIIQQKFHGAGVLVVDGFCRVHRVFTNQRALFRRQLRRRGDFYQFLIAPIGWSNHAQTNAPCCRVCRRGSAPQYDGG